MSKWINTLGYTVAFINKQAMVLVKGGDYYADYVTDPAWRFFANTASVDDARKIADALNAAIEEAG